MSYTIPQTTKCNDFPLQPFEVWIPPGSYFEGNRLIYRTAGRFMPGFLEVIFPELDRGKKYEMKRLISEGGFWLTH
jgi:hypothetical protein